MGFFGSKNKDAAKAAGATRKTTEGVVPPSTRKSVRRVVPAARGAAASTATQAKGPSTGRVAGAKPTVAEVAVEDIQLPSAPTTIDADQLDLGSAPESISVDPTPARPQGDQPILSSAAPDFAGSLGGARSGPSRTGDQVLLEFLAGKAGLLTVEQTNTVRGKAQNDGVAIDEAAVRLGLISEDQLVNALSQETWVPHLKVDKYEIRKKALDTITKEDAQHFGVFPVDKLGSLLTLAMVNPLDAEAIRQLESKTGLDIKKVVATRGEILQAIDKYYGGKVIASEGSRSFSQEVPDRPKSATQMLVKPQAEATPVVAAAPLFEPTPTKPVNIAPDLVGDIQDIDDLLGGEETIAPAIIEPVSIKPEESNDALELSDALITPAHAGSDPEFGLQDAPKQDTGALSRSVSDGIDLEKTDAIQLPPAPKPAASPAALVPARRGPAEARSATSRVAAGNAGPKVVNLVPVLEEEFRYAISHGKSKVFERWVALQSRNRIVNAVAVEKELDGVLVGLYAAPRKAG
jgi:hypothetical protein